MGSLWVVFKIMGSNFDLNPCFPYLYTSTQILHINSNIIMELSHDRLQQEIFMYCWNKYPQSRRCMWHTANEFPIQKGMSRKEHMIILSQRKAIGVLPGVTDLVLYQRGVLYMFDIKIGNDTLSTEQLSFIQANIHQGGQFFEIDTLPQGQKIIDRIFV